MAETNTQIQIHKHRYLTHRQREREENNIKIKEALSIPVVFAAKGGRYWFEVRLLLQHFVLFLRVLHASNTHSLSRTLFARTFSAADLLGSFPDLLSLFTLKLCPTLLCADTKNTYKCAAIMAKKILVPLPDTLRTAVLKIQIRIHKSVRLLMQTL